MTTYSSYEEAKINNPKSDIYKINDRFMGCNPSPNARVDHVVSPCNPADHCMTVEQFLKDGHKFIGGDVYLDDFGVVLVVGEDIGIFISNQPTGEDNDMFILRAAALNKPKRTKVEYVKVDISDVGFSDIADLFFMESDGNFVEIGGIDAAKLIADKWKLHRRIETEITERDVFIEKVEAIAEDITSDSEWSFACIATAMFDSGEFKLTKGE